MTFEIKGLVDYRLDRVDAGEGTSRGTPRLWPNSVVFCRRMYMCTNGMVDSWCLACLPFELVTSPQKTVSSRPSTELSSRPGQTTSYTRAAGPTITQPPQMETNRKRKASDDGLREAKARPPRSRVRDVKHKWSTFNSQAARRGIAQCLNYDQYVVLIRMPCAYCGHCPLDGFVGIDRIDSTKRQYCLLNCLPCCATCNFMKGSIDHHVFLRHVRAIASWRTGATFE